MAGGSPFTRRLWLEPLEDRRLLNAGAPVGGLASLATSGLAVGNELAAALYGANLSTTPTATHSTTTAIIAAPNHTVYGQSATFTSTVTAPGFGTPTGIVTFWDAGTLLDVATLVGGTTSFTTTGLAVGSHSITAVYRGDANFSTSTSVSLSQMVDKDATTTTLSAAPNPSVLGQLVSFTATVGANLPGSGTPTGTVTFKDGTTTLGSVFLSGGTASFTTSGLATGGHLITAVYGGDANLATSTSAVVSQVVTGYVTTTTLDVAPNPSVYGQLVTFTATVDTVPGAGTPTGTVTFLDAGVTLGTQTLLNGTTSFTTTELAAGSHPITAIYGGDAAFIPSTSTTMPQEVDKDATTTTLIAAPNPSVVGQAVTFTATVGANLPGSGTPTGTVIFRDGAATLGTGTLSDGSATFTTSTLAFGSHAITAVYVGDTNFLGSSTATSLTQDVRYGSTTTIVGAPNPAAYGQLVTFTATVISNEIGVGPPTGMVTFMDGTSVLGVGVLAGGTATFATSTLSAGSHVISAVYGGDADFAPSTGTMAENMVVLAVDTTTMITSNISARYFMYGQVVTLTATVSPNSPGAGTPTGIVTFKDGLAPQPTTTLGTATLDSSGVATITLPLLSTGSHSFVAIYGGDGNFRVSDSLVLKKRGRMSGTHTVITPPASPGVAGQPLTFTVTVTARSPSVVVPPGDLSLFDGARPLGTQVLDATGKATFTVILSAGPHTIRARYAGSTGLHRSNGRLKEQVASALMVAAPAASSAQDAPQPTGEQLSAITAEAERRWANAGGVEVLARMAGVKVQVANLPAGVLGEAVGNTILVDNDAAGYGWFVDPTAALDEEFAAAAGSQQLQAVDPHALDRIDLLTVVEHELGHILGLNDLDTASKDLMSGMLGAGARRNPTAIDAALAAV
jgi:hypothetical protein